IDPEGLAELGDGLVPNILGHRDAAQTSCPGLRLYIDLGSVRAQTRLRIGYVPRIGAELAAVRAATGTVEVGERVAFTFAVRTSGTIRLPAASPPPGLGYVEGLGAAARGLGVLPATVQLGLGTVEEIEAARVAAALAASGTGLHEAAGEDAPDPTRTPRPPLP